MSKREIEQTVARLVEQEWEVGNEVRVLDPQQGIVAPRVGEIVGISRDQVDVDIGDRVVTIAKNRLMSPEEEEPLEIPTSAPAGKRDFRELRMRRTHGALVEISLQVKDMLAEIEEHEMAGDWDLTPEELDGFRYKVNVLDDMVGRLKQP